MMSAVADYMSFAEKLFMSMNLGPQQASTGFLGNKTGATTGFGTGFGGTSTLQKASFGTFTTQNNTSSTNNFFSQQQQQPGSMFGQQAQQAQQPQQTQQGFGTSLFGQQQGFGSGSGFGFGTMGGGGMSMTTQVSAQSANPQQIMTLIGDMIKRQVADSPGFQGARSAVASVATEASTLDASLSKVLNAAPLASAAMRLSTTTRKAGAPHESFRLLDDRTQNRFGMSSSAMPNAAAAFRAKAVGLLPKDAPHCSEAEIGRPGALSNPTALHIDKESVPVYRIADQQPPAEDSVFEHASSVSQRPVLTRSDYTTIPPIAELQTMSLDDLRAVRDFTITSAANGEIHWPGETDLTGVDIDAIVEIGYRSAVVYPETLPYKDRHARGEKLNKEAVITLYNVFPVNRGERVYDLPSVEKFIAIINSTTLQREARLISYDPNTGVWKFAVDYFI